MIYRALLRSTAGGCGTGPCMSRRASSALTHSRPPPMVSAVSLAQATLPSLALVSAPSPPGHTPARRQGAQFSLTADRLSRRDFACFSASLPLPSEPPRHLKHAPGLATSVPKSLAQAYCLALAYRIRPIAAIADLRSSSIGRHWVSLIFEDRGTSGWGRIQGRGRERERGRGEKEKHAPEQEVKSTKKEALELFKVDP